VLLLVALVGPVCFLRVFRPTLRHVVATLARRRMLVVAARRFLVARAALHDHLSILTSYIDFFERVCLGRVENPYPL